MQKKRKRRFVEIRDLEPEQKKKRKEEKKKKTFWKAGLTKIKKNTPLKKYKIKI